MKTNLPPGVTSRDVEGPRDEAAEYERELERADMDLDLRKGDPPNLLSTNVDSRKQV